MSIMDSFSWWSMVDVPVKTFADALVHIEWCVGTIPNFEWEWGRTAHNIVQIRFKHKQDAIAFKLRFEL